MTAYAEPINALGRTAWTARDAIYVGGEAFQRAEKALRDSYFDRALASAKQAAEQANALVAALTTAHALMSVMDLSNEDLAEEARQKFIVALDN